MSAISPTNPGHPIQDDARRTDVPSWFWPDPRVPPLWLRGEWAFRRDLPVLLKKHKGKYVCYNGDRRIGIDRSERKLLDLCIMQGLIWYEYVMKATSTRPRDCMSPSGKGTTRPRRTRGFRKPVERR